jgi:hypothetical protein
VRWGARLGSVLGFGFAAGDGGSAKLFYGFEDGRAGLLAQNFAEQHAKRANVAAQRSFLKLAGGGLEFGEALWPVGGRPERGH